MTGSETSHQQSRPSLEEKLRLWQSLPDEEKVKIVRAILEKFIAEASKNPRRASLLFLSWLRSEDGAIVYPWMWKPRYRELMIDIAYYTLKGIESLAKSSIGL